MSARMDFIDRLDVVLDRSHQGLELGGSQLEQLLAEAGPRASKRLKRTPAYRKRLAEAAVFLTNVLQGERNPLWRHQDGVAIGMQEAMGTSDFPLLMGDIMDRSLLGRYQEVPATFRNYVGIRTARDFRTVREIALDGLEGRLYPDWASPEAVEPREGALSETGYTWDVDVFQRLAALNWRQIVNDDLDAFSDIPARFARAARRTEEYFAANLFVDANGPHASFYTSGNANIINTTNLPSASDDNPALSTVALQDGLTLLAAAVDADGEPIMFESVELVVPQALEITARNIIDTVEYRVTDSSGNVIQVITGNGLRKNLRVSVNHYISQIATTNGTTSWFLIATPAPGSRPALRMGFLRGYEEPGIYRRAGNTERVGGGVVQELGDFLTNEQAWKVMHILGGTRMDYRLTVASNGSGT